VIVPPCPNLEADGMAGPGIHRFMSPVSLISFTA
jgi:hypothetical protein